MYSKRKLFIFHNEKAVSHIETQPNQSRYIESLIINDLQPKQEANVITLLQQYLSTQPIQLLYTEPSQDIQTSILNTLDLT
jgi:hypothetical protein